MILKQYYLGCLAHASYLIADEKTGAAVVVDPQRDIDQYLEDAVADHLEIRHVVLTHFHADFLAGHIELRDRVGASILLGRAAKAEYGFRPVGEGDRLELGSVRLEFLETPGHTPEGISILVFDLDRDPDRPHAVLTGDTLFIGDVGRPDLMASVGMTAEELASSLYDSLRDKLLKLPDETLIYPAHGAGSMCGKNLSTDTVSTMGEQRRLNYALRPMSKGEFVELVTADQPEAPEYFAYDAVLNRRERATLAESLARSLKPLGLEEVLRLQNTGAQILDTRDPGDFAAAHLAGSVNIGLGGKYATWAGTLLDRERPIVIVSNPGSEEESATRLGRIGFDQVAGFLEDGMMALKERPDLVGAIERVTASDLADEIDRAEEAPLILDVRADGERQAGAIPGSVHIPLPRLEERSGELPRDRRILIHCQSGYRSSIAASLLERAGWSRLADLIGGFSAFAKLEVADGGDAGGHRPTPSRAT